MKRFLALAVAVIFLAGCVTNTMVTIETNPPEATVYVDHKEIGESPVTVQMSNAVWNDPDILIQLPGYKDLRTSVEKEIKVANLVSGLLLIWPAFLWVYGPEKYQYFDLIEE